MAKIAIIGSGISGLGAAYLLHRRHDITVYEKENYIGGHSRTLTVKTDKKSVAVDTGFIVFNKPNYPHLTALFEHLHVPIAKSDMSFGVSIDNGWLEYGTRRLINLLAQKSNLFRKDFYRMISDILRFNKRAKAFIESHPNADMRQCLQALGMRQWFQDYYLLAMGGAIWSAPVNEMLSFPAETMVCFFENHGLLNIIAKPQWYTVQGGSKEYIRRLSDSFRDRIRLNCAVRQVERSAKSAYVRDEAGQRKEYDAVIFACHSDEALGLIKNPTQAEKDILGAIRYRPNRALLHSDISFMPKRKSAWCSWVYLRDRHYHKPPGISERSVSLSYWMNNLQPLRINRPIFVTLNPGRNPDPQLTYDEHVFRHPLLDKSAIAAQAKILRIQGNKRFWFCGAWQAYGFHEDGLRSAVNIAQKLGADIPWTTPTIS